MPLAHTPNTNRIVESFRLPSDGDRDFGAVAIQTMKDAIDASATLHTRRAVSQKYTFPSDESYSSDGLYELASLALQPGTTWALVGYRIATIPDANGRNATISMKSADTFALAGVAYPESERTLRMPYAILEYGVTVVVAVTTFGGANLYLQSDVFIDDSQTNDFVIKAGSSCFILSSGTG